jgi:hypothetical protein
VTSSADTTLPGYQTPETLRYATPAG